VPDFKTPQFNAPLPSVTKAPARPSPGAASGSNRRDYPFHHRAAAGAVIKHL